MDLEKLLKMTVEKGSSDLHLSTGEVPMVRVNGDITKLEGESVVTADELQNVLHGIMTESHVAEFADKMETDFSHKVNDLAIFRVNAFQQMRGPSAVFRVIPFEVPTLEQMQLPQIFRKFCNFKNGLVLVTGPTGSGKSTTLAGMINHINNDANTHKHIITIEDPVEYIYKPNHCLINQREVGKDTSSFASALRVVLREDPDIILVGEMRDIETIRLALTAAETGHLVLATLHTNSASKAVDRIIDSFPGGEKEMIRSMLSESLRAVIAQNLIKRSAGGLMAATEVMVCTPAIRNLIRENKIPQMYSAIQTGKEHGMWTMEQDIDRLVKEGMAIAPEGFSVH